MNTGVTYPVASVLAIRLFFAAMLRCVGLGDGVLNRASDTNISVALSVMARIAELTLMQKIKQSGIRLCKYQ